MKKLRIVICLFVLFSVFGCSRNANPKTENKLFFNKVMDTMQKNDSFKIKMHSIATIDGEEVDGGNVLYYFNNYYDDSTRESIVETNSRNEQIGEDNLKVIYKNRVTNIYLKGEHKGSPFEMDEFYINLEFLKLDKKDIEDIKFNEKDRKLTFTLNSKDETLLNSLFKHSNQGQEEESDAVLKEGKYELILNKNNTIKSCKRTVVMTVEGYELTGIAEIDILNYKKQKIELPSDE